MKGLSLLLKTEDKVKKIRDAPDVRTDPVQMPPFQSAWPLKNGNQIPAFGSRTEENISEQTRSYTGMNQPMAGCGETI